MTSLQTVTRQRKSTSCLLQYAINNRKQGRFNDVTLQSNDTRIPANRMILFCYCLFLIKSLNQKQIIKSMKVELHEVNKFCFKFLENCMTSDNYITIVNTAKQYKKFTLKNKVYKHISDNYEVMTKTP